MQAKLKEATDKRDEVNA